MSKFDYLYRKFLLSKFFTKGWGDPNNLRRILKFRKTISDRENCAKLVPDDYPIIIDKDIEQRECRLLQGHFHSPFDKHLPGIMPEEVKIARFQMLMPRENQKDFPKDRWKGKLKPVCIHLAGTGDHGFYRRKVLMARPLLKQEGIASIILENPYYGVRKPKQQRRSALHNVSDLFVMGGALVLECLALMHWCERHNYGPLGLTGLSMGGHMASLAATNWCKPVALIPCLSWSTASSVFTQGAMSGAIPWKLLEEQYHSDKVYQEEICDMLECSDEGWNSEAFKLGQSFAKTFVHYNSVSDSSSYKSNSGELASQKKGKDTSDNQPKSSHSSKSKNYHTSAQGTFVTADDGIPTDVSNAGVKRWRWLEKVLDEARIQKENREKQQTVHESDSRSSLSYNTEAEVLCFMKGVMDECTHLGNFSIPVDPSLVIVVVAKDDGYIPRDNVKSIRDLWPSAEIRQVDTGHITAFLTKQTVFRRAIADAFDKLITKHHKHLL